MRVSVSLCNIRFYNNSKIDVAHCFRDIIYSSPKSFLTHAFVEEAIIGYHGLSFGNDKIIVTKTRSGSRVSLFVKED